MNSIIRLSDLSSGEEGVIYKIEGLEKAKHKRLIELGFVFNTPIFCIKKQPKQRLMLVGIRSFTLSLDLSLCDKIKVYKRGLL